MKWLIGCEESQAVTVALRERGHEAYSCDILPCSGGHPEWHYQADIFEVLHGGGFGVLIAFPPCTHLAVSGAAWFEQKRKDGRQQEGVDFFMRIANYPIQYKAIENPMGIMSKLYRKPDQIIQPYYFGDEFQKTTCLWLTGLKKLQHFSKSDMFAEKTHVSRGNMIEYASGKRMPEWYANAYKLTPKERSNMRSKTFPGIANAMAEQWGNYMKGL